MKQNSIFRNSLSLTPLKLLFIFMLVSMPFGCSESDDTETTTDPGTNANFMVFTNQTGDPNANALQAQYIDVENNGVMDIYGTFNADGTPKQITNVRYKKANNDSLVNVLIDEFTGKPTMAIMEVNGLKQNIVTEFAYTDSENEIIISFYDHDFELGTSELLYSAKYNQDEDGIKETPVFVQKYTSSNSLWGVFSCGICLSGGIVAAELASIVGGGVSLYSGALLPVAAAISSVGIGAILTVGTVALLLSEIANASEVTPQDVPYPENTPPTNPINEESIPELPENPCIDSNLSVVIGLDPCNEIVAIASGGASGPMAFYWSTGESIETDTFTSIIVDTVGTYSVGIIDSAGCAATNTITVDELDESGGCEDETGFTDPRDGQVYPLVQIGNQTWFAKNLNYATASGSWCYDDDPANCATYGRLYNGQTALTACPPGYHLPSDAEWTELTDYLGGIYVAGGKMKSTTGWNSPNTAATNSSGFSGFPGGFRNGSGYYYSVGYNGYWWSSSESSPSGAWFRRLNFNNGYVTRSSFDKANGFSCRCLRD